jgi:hypothetical protein
MHTSIKEHEMSRHRVDRRGVAVDLIRSHNIAAFCYYKLASRTGGMGSDVKKAFEWIRIDVALVAGSYAHLDVKIDPISTVSCACYFLTRYQLSKIAKHRTVQLVKPWQVADNRHATHGMYRYL